MKIWEYILLSLVSLMLGFVSGYFMTPLEFLFMFLIFLIGGLIAAFINFKEKE